MILCYLLNEQDILQARNLLIQQEISTSMEIIDMINANKRYYITNKAKTYGQIYFTTFIPLFLQVDIIIDNGIVLDQANKPAIISTYESISRLRPLSSYHQTQVYYLYPYQYKSLLATQVVTIKYQLHHIFLLLILQMNIFNLQLFYKHMISLHDLYYSLEILYIQNCITNQGLLLAKAYDIWSFIPYSTLYSILLYNSRLLQCLDEMIVISSMLLVLNQGDIYWLKASKSTLHYRIKMKQYFHHLEYGDIITIIFFI